MFLILYSLVGHVRRLARSVVPEAAYRSFGCSPKCGRATIACGRVLFSTDSGERGGPKMSGIPDSLGGFFMTPRNGIRLQSEGQLVGIPVCSCLFGPPFHHRRHAEIENAIRDLKYGVGLNHMPSGRFATNGAWLAVQVMAHNLARWTARIGLGEQIVTTKTLRRRFFGLAGRDYPLGAPPHPASATALALGNPVQPRPGTAARPATPSLTAHVRH